MLLDYFKAIQNSHTKEKYLQYGNMPHFSILQQCKITTHQPDVIRMYSIESQLRDVPLPHIQRLLTHDLALGIELLHSPE